MGTEFLKPFADWTGMPLEKLESAGWEAWPVLRGAEVAAVLAIQGFEVHFAISPRWRGRLGVRSCCQALGKLFDLRGLLTTRVSHDDAIAKRFVERLGFALTQSDSGFDHYMLSAMPYSRGA